MAARFHSWNEESRKPWGKTLDDGQFLSNQDILVGCLQRIANALEGIEKGINPERREAKRKLEEEKASWALSEHNYNVVETPLESALKALYRGKPDRAAMKESIRKVTHKLVWQINGRGERLSSFDPIAFDWSQILSTVGPVTRARFTRFIELARAAQPA